MKKVVSILILSALALTFVVGYTGRVEASTVKVAPKTTKIVSTKKVVKKVVKKKITKKKKVVVGREPILSAPLLAPDPAFYKKK